MAHFGSIFPIFGAKKCFLGNPALSCTTSYGFPAPCQKLEKVNNSIQRKHLDRTKDRRTRMDRPYFIGPFRLPPGVQKGTRFIQGNVYFGITVFSSYWFTKPFLRFLLICFTWAIKAFYQSSLGNEVDLMDIINVSQISLLKIEITKNGDTIL